MAKSKNAGNRAFTPVSSEPRTVTRADGSKVTVQSSAAPATKTSETKTPTTGTTAPKTPAQTTPANHGLDANVQYSGRPDMSRNNDITNQTVKQGAYSVTYDSAGRAVKAVKNNGATATSADPSKSPELNQLAAKNPTVAAVVKAAQEGNWNLAGSIANNLHTPVTKPTGDPGTNINGTGEYDTTERDRIWSLVTDVYGYDKDAYVDKLYNDAYGGGSGAGNGAGTPATGFPNAGGTATPGAVAGAGGGYNSNTNIKVSGTPGTGYAYDAPDMRSFLDQWLAASQSQIQNRVDFATQQGINELTRAEEDAQEQFQTQRNQIAADEAKAKDNQALYAEARGDKGGIGAAQYDSIMNTAAQNHQTVNSAQTKLATDTARQIADLRAQGEFEKADKLLTLSQTYLSQLMSLEQWGLEFGLSVAQFNASLDQWAKEFDLSVADMMGTYNGLPTMSAQKMQFEMDESARAQQAGIAEMLMGYGIMPSPDQLAALGLTEAQAQDIMTAQQMAAAVGGGGGGNGGVTPAPGQDYNGLMSAARLATNPEIFIRNNAKKYGFDDSESALKELYGLYNRDYVDPTKIDITGDAENGIAPQVMNEQNDHGIYIPSADGRYNTYSSWEALSRLIETGEVRYVFDHQDEDGRYYYRLVYTN